MTALKSAFEAAGSTQAENDLRIAISKFLNHGGTCERLIAICNESVALASPADHLCVGHESHWKNVDRRQPIASAGDHIGHAANGQFTSASPAREPIPGEGHVSIALQGRGQNADSGNPIASGNVQTPLAKSGHLRGDAPAREPTPSDLDAMANVGDLSFSRVLRLRGKLLANYRFGELKNARALNNYENVLITELQDYRIDKRISDDTLIKDGISEAELRKIVERSKRALPSNARVFNG